MAEGLPGEILIEYIRIGATVRVTAVDVKTGTEISFQAPANAQGSDMKRLAARKLHYVMSKKT